jgi:HAD superfamily hydrolase (TIGR01662 family)
VIRAVVFDVGETLIDESRLWERWADWLGVPRLTFLGVIGGMAALDRSHWDAFRTFRPEFDLETELASWATDEPDSMRENFDGDDLYPDVRPALAALRDRGYRVIVAGNQPPQAEDALKAMDLPVDGIYTSAGWGVGKPAPAFFAKVAEVAGYPPAEICYVGDRLDNDVRPARRAGFAAVLMRRGPWGYLHAQRPAAAAEADAVLDRLTDLPDWLAGRE